MTCHVFYGFPLGTSVPAVVTLDPAITGTTSAFNGQTLSFPPGNSLQVYYKYDKGIVLFPTFVTAAKTVTALLGTTPIPDFPVMDPCNDYSYQVVQKSRFSMRISVFLSYVPPFMSPIFYTRRALRI